MTESATPRVLHIELGRNRFGGTMQSYYIARGVNQLGFESAMVTPVWSPLHQLCDDAKVKTYPIKYFGDGDISLLWKLKKIIKDFAPKIIHIHSRRGADTVGLLAARWFGGGAKVILSRRVDDPVPAGVVSKWRYQTLPDQLVAVSKGIVKALVLAGVPETSIEQIYSAIEIEKYQVTGKEEAIRAEFGIDGETRVIAVIGQLIPRKGQRFLVEALPTLLKTFPKIKLLLLGEGESEPELREQVKQLNLAEQVVFAGYRDDVGAVLSVVDVLVHPALMEGFANVAMQAMAAGVPVVSSDVGGMGESVRHEQTGLLVPPGDVPALVDAVSKLLSDEALRHQLGKTGMQVVQDEFTVEISIGKYANLYRKILNVQ